MALWTRTTKDKFGNRTESKTIDTLRDPETWPEPVVWRDTREVSIRWKDGRTTTYIWTGQSPNMDELGLEEIGNPKESSEPT